MSRIKVVHIITKMELGGAQQNTLFSVSHLDPQRFLAYLITGTEGELIREARTLRRAFFIPDLIREIRPARDLKAFFQLYKALQNIRGEYPSDAPMLVHTHSSKAGILGRWSAWCSGVHTIIHSIHGFGFHDYQPFLIRTLFILIEKFTSGITTKFIAVSKANMEKGISLGLFSAPNVTLIRSGIDIARFQHPTVSKQQLKESLGLPENAPVVAMIACLKPQKAPLDFIRVCSLVAREIPETRFLLIGDGYLRNSVAREIETHNLGNHVYLLGWRRDIPDILHATNVLALTSLWEGLPQVFPQAMAAGIPLVATCVDGALEVVHEGINGFLLKPGDCSGMAKKIITLLRDPEKARAMGKRGSELVAEFDIHKMVRQQEALYESLICAREPAV